MLRLLWSHCRDIRVEVFKNKIVYNIPVYSEKIFKDFNFKVEQCESGCGLRLTIIKPAESLSEEPLN
jgi:hypothetical protein